MYIYILITCQNSFFFASKSFIMKLNEERIGKKKKPFYLLLLLYHNIAISNRTFLFCVEKEICCVCSSINLDLGEEGEEEEEELLTLRLQRESK